MNPAVRQLLMGDGPAVNPANVSGCFMCFDVWRTDKVTLVGSQVSSLTDIISGTSLTQGTSSARPTSDGNWINSDGVDDNLAYTAGAISGWPTSGDIDVVGLVNCLSANTDSGTKTLIEFPNSASNGFSLRRTMTNGQSQFSSSIGTGGGASTYIHRNTDMSGKHIIRYSHPSGGVPTFWVDDVKLVPSSTASTASWGSATRYRLFATAGASAGGFGFFGIHLLAGFTRILPEADWRGIRSFLRARRRAV